MLNLKFNYQSQNRRCMIAESSASYAEVWRNIRSLYSTFVFTDSHVLRWEDEEKDKILVSSDSELSCAFATMSSMRAPVYKFDIVLDQEPSTSAAPDTSSPCSAPPGISGQSTPAAAPSGSHAHVTCDECGVSPITGVRFKCTVRHDFDLCGGCESKVAVQPFPMVKLYIPAQTWTGGCGQYGRGWARAQRAHAHAQAYGGGCPAPASTGPLFNHSVHHGVQCDECGCQPIHGNRFKCTVRHDFDLCGVCEAKAAVQPFPMLKIYSPEQVQYLSPPQPGPRQPHRRHWGPWPGAGPRHGPPRWVHSVVDTGKDVADFAVNLSNSAIHVVADALEGIHRKQGRGCQRKQGAKAQSHDGAPHDVPAVPASTGAAPAPGTAPAPAPAATPAAGAATNSDVLYKEEEMVELEVWNDECLQEAIEYSIRSIAVAPKSSNGGDFSVGSSTASVSVAGSQAAPEEDGDFSSVTVVTDVTYPSGSPVEAGAQFKKIWLVRNTGTAPWPADTYLRVAASPSALFCAPDTRVPIGHVAPGAEVQVAVNMRVDPSAGPTDGGVTNFINVFCLASQAHAAAAEVVFSDLLFLDVNVGASEACADAVSASNIMAACMSSLDASDLGPDNASTVAGTGGDGWEDLGGVSPSPSSGSLDEAFAARTGSVAVTEESSAEPASSEPAIDVSRWGHELATLADMGFCDEVVLLPLLERLVLRSKAELLASDEQNNPGEEMVQIATRAHGESLQAVVMELLGASGGAVHR